MTQPADEKLARALIRQHEGYSPLPYTCPAGKLTIGYGRNIEENGIRVEEAEFMLSRDIDDVIQALKKSLGGTYEGLSPTRKAVLIDMAYNLGMPRVLKFQKMLAALAASDFALAAEEMLDSRWARQVGQRATRLADIMRLDVVRNDD